MHSDIEATDSVTESEDQLEKKDSPAAQLEEARNLAGEINPVTRKPWTQKQISDKTGIPKRTLYNLGRRGPPKAREPRGERGVS